MFPLALTQFTKFSNWVSNCLLTWLYRWYNDRFELFNKLTNIRKVQSPKSCQNIRATYNLNFIPTPKVYNKNELDADLNDFFRRIKLKAYFKDTPNNKNDDESRMFKQNKNKKWTPPNNHHAINTYLEAVKKISSRAKKFHQKR